MERGTICYTTLVGGLGHDQGTRTVLVLGKRAVSAVTGETIVLPVSHVQPVWPYPFSWPVPPDVLPQRCWVLISRPRAAVVARLRDAIAVLDREQLDEIVAGLRQLVAE